jgi:hypothetical protein
MTKDNTVQTAVFLGMLQRRWEIQYCSIQDDFGKNLLVLRCVPKTYQDQFLATICLGKYICIIVVDRKGLVLKTHTYNGVLILDNNSTP